MSHILTGSIAGDEPALGALATAIPAPPSRRRFWVNPEVQTAIIVPAVVSLLVHVALLGLALFLPVAIQVMAQGSVPSGKAEAATELLLLDERFWRAVVLALPISVLIALRASHRIAGPLVRFGKTFDTIAAGALPPAMRLRRNDVLHGEARRVNAMLGTLADRERKLRRAGAELALAERELPADSPARARLEAVRSELQSAVLRC